MSATGSEHTPLLSQSDSTSPKPKPKPKRTVTFNSHIATNEATTAHPKTSIQDLEANVSASTSAILDSPSSSGSASVISTINNKLRRRNSQNASTINATPAASPHALLTPGGSTKIGPQRTTKIAQKLKILPDTDAQDKSPANEDDGDDDSMSASNQDVYTQYTRLNDPTSRRHAARLGREDRKRLPRVTAYCTAGRYRLEELMRFLKGYRARERSAAPILFDECVYTPWAWEENQKRQVDSAEEHHQQQLQQLQQPRRYSDSVVEVGSENDRNNLDFTSQGNGDQYYNEVRGSHFGEREYDEQALDFDIEVHTPEVFLFNYGTIVIWGMTLRQEQRFLKEISKFEVEKLAKDDIQTEDFNFYYTKEYQARIYNDFISLRDKKNYMTKLAISHALSQSVKTSLFEDLVDNTIEATKDIPSQIATTGKVNLSSKEINMQIGELFILRINIHLQGSVLDAPELMWAEPQLDPVYQAVRSYLEMDQRVALLTERLNVIADLLAVLKDQLTHTHGEYLEWIVIVLIAAEILVAAANIVVDIYAGD